MKWPHFGIVGFIALTIVSATFAKPQVSFPGQADLIESLPNLTFTLPYHQYSGYLNSINGAKMFYWFIESQSSYPERDPVTLWFNGGPGCSSMYGAFWELGPIRLELNGTFTQNPYTWNQKSNLIFLESPVWVGFSYNPNAGNSVANDNTTLHQNLGALQSFFVKFPHLANNDFYITGESYAGQYIPQLAVELVKQKFPVNFKGVAIGNGAMDWKDLEETNDDYKYYHGIQLKKQISSYFDVYNILDDCVDSAEMIADPSQLCDNRAWMHKYFNLDAVRKAIHVDAQFQKLWWTCNSTLTNVYQQDRHSMAPNIKYLVDSGLKVVIYNGDLDSMCQFLGDKLFTERLGYKVVSPYQAWTDADGFVGGFRKQFEKNLIFLTIRGAGHMVPTDKPGPALKMFNEFLLGN